LDNAPVFIVLAFILPALLVWRFKRRQFQQLGWKVVGIGSALFWGVFATLLFWYAWDFYYRYYAPAWSRFAAPLSAMLFYFLLALLFRQIALHLPGNPTLTFCLLGGLEALPEHAVAIYRFHILDIPVLQGMTAVEIFVFAFFEYVVYWSLALCLVIALDWAISSYQKRARSAR
jgi:hypothetical protein